MMRVRRLLITATLSVCFVAATCLASDLYTMPRQKGVPGARPAQHWADVVGSTVVGEGIAWGFYDKGFGPYVIIDGARVYVAGLDKERGKLDGKLIRVTGTLEVHKQPAAPPTSQGVSQDVIIYSIHGATWKAIDRVEWPYLEVVDSKK